MSGGGYAKIHFEGGPTSSTLFIVEIADLSTSYIQTYSITVGPTDEIDHTFTLPLHGATLSVSEDLTVLNVIEIGPPPINDHYVLGCNVDGNLDAIFSSHRVAHFPDRENSIHHRIQASPSSNSTVKFIPKADGSVFFRLGDFSEYPGYGTPPNWHLIVEEGTLVPPAMEIIAEEFVD